MKGVEDALGRLDGVHSVQVDLQSNLVTIVPRSDVELHLEEIPRTVRRAGYTPGEMRIVARGSFRSEQGLRFRIRGWRTELGAGLDRAPPSHEVELRARVEWTQGDLRLVPLQW